MNSNEISSRYSIKTFSEIKANFALYQNRLHKINNNYNHKYPHFEREQMIKWLILLCHNLCFRTETLFRSISLFDIYMNKISIKSVGCLKVNSKVSPTKAEQADIALYKIL